MDFQNFLRSELPFFGRLVELLGNKQSELIPLIELPFSKENFGKQMLLKQNFSLGQRDVLVRAVGQQYQNCNLEAPLGLNQLLQNNCFTVCTGHQLNLFSGPLYMIYKIAHAIKLAEQLNTVYPEKIILPIFWMASEDHDFEEINHFFVGDKKISWSSQQTGPVGRMRLDNWSTWQQELLALFPNQKSQISELLKVYQGENLAQATRNLIHHVFQNTPLIIVDGDDVQLKKSFEFILLKEVLEQFSHQELKKSAEIIRSKGIKEQAFAREINLFHLGKESRIRLESVDDKIKIGDEFFDRDEIVENIQKHPENFSPNVILRPLYQEVVLPNLCYIGGSGELAYWLQLKPVFDAAQVAYPLLQLRISAHFLSDKQLNKMNKLGFTYPKFSQKLDVVLKDFLIHLSSRNNNEHNMKLQLEQLRSILTEQAKQVDSTLIASAEAQVKRIEHIVANFNEKLSRYERKIHKEKLERARLLHKEFFPNGGLQERQENFISFFIQNRSAWLDEFLNNLDVFDQEFIVVKQD
jgi:bacillithiol biosynthesis cysteine-adding enzyme BshC